MKTYNLNFSKVVTQDDFHAVIKSSLDCPDYYGRNLDALWDVLTGYIETPSRLMIVGAVHLEEKLGGFGKAALNMFHEAAKEVPELGVVVSSPPQGEP